MIKSTNKFTYLFVVQSNYQGYGWEDVDETEDSKNARFLVGEYRLACPDSSHRMIRRRELNVS